MDEQGWEEERGRRLHPLLLAVGVLLAIVGVALLARPPAGPGEAALEGRLTTGPAEVEPAPAPTSSPGPVPEPSPTSAVAPGADDGQAPRSAVFDPATRWRPVSRAPFRGPVGGPGAWDGRRLVVWPGEGSGGIYAPQVDAWAALPPAPIRRTSGWSATWSGEEVLFWGGRAPDGEPAADGVALSTDRMTWRVLPQAPLAGRSGHAAAWGGGRLWVWGGVGADGFLADGASYDPAADRWEPMPPAPLSPRADSTAVWTGDSLLVWGGRDVDASAPDAPAATLVDGARYRPGEGWTAIADAPTAHRGKPATVWVPPTACIRPPGCGVLLVWGTPAAGLHLRDGYAYHLTSDAWTELPNLLSQTRHDAAAVWAGQAAAVWGGNDWRGAAPRRDGYLYDPETERWVQIPAAPVDPGPTPTVAFTGEDLLVVGEAGGWRYPLADALER